MGLGPFRRLVSSFFLIVSILLLNFKIIHVYIILFYFILYYTILYYITYTCACCFCGGGGSGLEFEEGVEPSFLLPIRGSGFGAAVGPLKP